MVFKFFVVLVIFINVVLYKGLEVLLIFEIKVMDRILNVFVIVVGIFLLNVILYLVILWVMLLLWFLLLIGVFNLFK